MKILVLQQLGDKFGLDSSLNALKNYVKEQPNMQLKMQEREPLEELIKTALNYDSNVYKEALGISTLSFGEPNGVMKSQELNKF